jgi:hypothetical protein
VAPDQIEGNRRPPRGVPGWMLVAALASSVLLVSGYVIGRAMFSLAHVGL